MELEWMGQYRPLIEAFIQFANVYAREYKKPSFKWKVLTLSAASIQVLEYVFESEGTDVSMKSLSDRLGITRGAFTKIVDRLCVLGLLKKHHPKDNLKEYRLLLTDKGRHLYADYSKYIYDRVFAKFFEVFKLIPEHIVVQMTELFKTGAK